MTDKSPRNSNRRAPSIDKMYIKQIVLEGFKSYAQRTEVTGFDPLFNAITGLNGSGKSNILDAICFLLGITNLSQVHTHVQFIDTLILAYLWLHTYMYVHITVTRLLCSHNL